MELYTDRELLNLLNGSESDCVERKQSLKGDTPKKARQAVCAFANDLPNHNKPGVLFIGACDDGNPSKEPITDQMLRYSTWRDTIYEEFGKFGKSVPGETQKLGLMNHNGVDLHAAAGDKIRAVAAGTICAAGSDFRVPGLWPEGKNKGYSLKESYESYGTYAGFSIIISHGNGFYTHYAHMSTSKKISIGENTYDPEYPEGNPDDQSTPSMIGLKVKAGNVIGHSGTAVKDPHLHFEIRYLGTAETPEFFLNPEYYFKESGIPFVKESKISFTY